MRAARTLLVAAAIAALLATGCEWHFETLDGNGGGNGRTTNAVGRYSEPIIYNGRPHVFYYDSASDDLRHAYYNGQAWAFEVLDGAGGPNGRTTDNVGQYNAAILYNGRPHVFYYSTSGDLRHAYYNGQAWAFETLDGKGGGNGRTTDDLGDHGAVVLYNDRPHVFYYDNTVGGLRHAYYSGQAWAFETLDGAGGPNGRTTDNVGQYNVAILYNGRPHVFYFDNDNARLRHAYWNGVFWAFETLDGNGGPNGRTTNGVGAYNAVILYNGRPHAFYFDANDQAVRHAYYNGVAWAFETLDGNGGPNGRTTNGLGLYNAATLYNGRPQVFYYEFTNGTLRHAYYNGQAWGFETLDGNGGPNGRTMDVVGQYNSALLYGTGPHVFYEDPTNNDLRHAYFG